MDYLVTVENYETDDNDNLVVDNSYGKTKGHYSTMGPSEKSSSLM